MKSIESDAERGVIRSLVISLALWGLIGGMALSLAGCKIILTDDGEVGFKQSTSWGFYHTAKETKATSTSETKPMSLEAWFANEKAGMTIVETTTESPGN